MEVVIDYNLWLWYPSIGWAGSLNGINIWDASSLHKLLLKAIFELPNFKFTIVEEEFTSL